MNIGIGKLPNISELAYYTENIYLDISSQRKFNQILGWECLRSAPLSVEIFSKFFPPNTDPALGVTVTGNIFPKGFLIRKPHL
jgi:hypothetical protein